MCNDDICCWCPDEREYSKGGTYHGTVCKDCADDNNLVSYEESKTFESVDTLVRKLKKDEALTENERESLIKILEDL